MKGHQVKVALRARIATIIVAILAATGIVVGGSTNASAVEIRLLYVDYFYSKATCESRATIEKRLYPDIIMTWCVKLDGDTKWSMRAALDDGTGCVPPPNVASALWSERDELQPLESIACP